MNKKELKIILQRYTQSLKGASGETIITNYGRMRDFVYELNEEELGKELCFLCKLYTLRQALRVVKEENISIKDCTNDWNSRAVAKGYQLHKEIEPLYSTRPKSQELKNKLLELGTLAVDEPSIGTGLFLKGLYFSHGVLSDDSLNRLKELLNDSTEPTN